MLAELHLVKQLMHLTALLAVTLRALVMCLMATISQTSVYKCASQVQPAAATSALERLAVSATSPSPPAEQASSPHRASHSL